MIPYSKKRKRAKVRSVYLESLALHARMGGKIEMRAKRPLRTRHDLTLLYTPGVAEACRVIAKDKKKARVLTMKKNMVAIISDGSAVLGLGNIGAEGSLPVMEGKAVLFKELAGVDAIPIVLDTQDTDEIVRIVRAIAPGFAGINMEDISAPRCFEIENRLRNSLDIPVMHDDQWGTAVVVLAALINATKLRSLLPKNARVVINGAGAAGIATAEMLLYFGFRDVILVDRTGAIVKTRTDLSGKKREIALHTNPRRVAGNLSDALLGAHIFIGLSAPNVVTKNMVQSMVERPIIFAMANPVPEIMPDLAHKAGAFIVATGRSDFPNQVNNVLAFPGIFRGLIDGHIRLVTPAILVRAARTLAGAVKHPSTKNILPSPLDRLLHKKIARAVQNAR